MALPRTQPTQIDDPEEAIGLLHEPIISIPDRDDPTKWRHFFTEEEADSYVTPEDIARARAVAGAWSDLDLDEMLDALDRIRHESVPTPPIEFDWDDE